MTVRKTRDIYVRRRRASLTDVYCSSENFRIAYPNETGQSGTAETPAYGGIKVGMVMVLPGPHNLDGWPAFEQNGCGAAILDARFGEYQCPGATVGVLTIPSKGYALYIRLDSFVHVVTLTDGSHPITPPLNI